MPITAFNDAEDEALRRLPWRARIVYLQGIRRYMDYSTGWSGKRRVLSYQFFIELLDCGERTTAPDPKVSKDGLRAIFRMLERVGLVEWPRGTSQQRGVVFRCLLADTDQSAQNKDAPKTHPRRTQQDAPSKASNHAASGESSAPKAHPARAQQDAPPPVSGNPVKREANASPPPCDEPSRFDEFWDAWPAATGRKRDKHKARLAWKRHKLDRMADMIIDDVRRRAIEDQQWLRGYAPLPTTYINGHRWEDEFDAPTDRSNKPQTAAEQRAAAAAEIWENFERHDWDAPAPADGSGQRDAIEHPPWH